jgi:hypothetical protein
MLNHSHTRLVFAGILGLTAILLGMIIALITTDLGASAFALATISPAFDDPRLSITLAYPFRGPDGFLNATAQSMEYFPQALQKDYIQTRGVQDCTLYLSSMTTIIGSCTVDEGLNTVEMAELLRLLGERQYYNFTINLRLDDGITSTRYEWGFWRGGWEIAPLTHPTFDDPRLALVIAYNPPVDFRQTVPPATPDPRPYDVRIRSAFEDTPGVQACTITLEENPYPPQAYGYVGETGHTIVNADCTIEPTFNTVEMAEWLRRLANRALLDTNAITCEDAWVCDAILTLPVANLTLDDGSVRTRYAWNGRGWVIEAEDPEE